MYSINILTFVTLFNGEIASHPTKYWNHRLWDFDDEIRSHNSFNCQENFKIWIYIIEASICYLNFKNRDHSEYIWVSTAFSKLAFHSKSVIAILSEILPRKFGHGFEWHIKSCTHNVETLTKRINVLSPRQRIELREWWDAALVLQAIATNNIF